MWMWKFMSVLIFGSTRSEKVAVGARRRRLTRSAGTWANAWLPLFIYFFLSPRLASLLGEKQEVSSGPSTATFTGVCVCVLIPNSPPQRIWHKNSVTVRHIPDGEQLVQEVGCSSQQGSSGDVQGLLPPGVGAQNRHDASVVLQREGDDISIQRLLLLGAAQPQRQAVIPPEFNHTRPGRGKASGPVHPPLPRLQRAGVLPAALPFRLHLNARRVVYGMAAGRRVIFIQKCRSKHLNCLLPGTMLNSTLSSAGSAEW